MKKLVSAFSIFLAALLLAGPVPAAAAPKEEDLQPIDLTGHGAGYAAVLYDITNGLTTSEANAVIQSEDGFIWIGGYSGLTRYDGNNFLRYDSSYGITSVVCLFVDSQSRLWIGTNDSGAAVLSNNEITFYNGAGIMKSSYVRVITEDENGNILIGTTMGMAAVDSEGVLRAVNEPQINGGYINELVPGPEGLVYGCTQAGDVFIIKDLRVSAFFSADSLPYGTVNTVCPDGNDPGNVWLGTREGEIVYANAAKGMALIDRHSISPHSSANCVRLISGNLWVCADNGVGFFTNGVYVPLENLPMNNSIDNVMADHEGNLWFTSSRQGVMKIARDRFIDLNTAAHLNSAVVNSTLLSGGLLYIATDTGLIVIDGEYERVENGLTEYLGGSRIRCVRGDSSGHIWFCTYGSKGLVRCDPASGGITSFTEENGLLSNRTRSVMELEDKSIAVATNSGVNIIRDGDIAPELSLGAACHHERYDGKGYPNGLKGDEIPEVARIIAVADTFDAMYSTRPYRKRMELSVVAAEIERSSGTQLDPEVVKAFMELYRDGAFDNE